MRSSGMPAGHIRSLLPSIPPSAGKRFRRGGCMFHVKQWQNTSIQHTIL